MLKKITSLFLMGALMLGAAATAEGVSGTAHSAARARVTVERLPSM